MIRLVRLCVWFLLGFGVVIVPSFAFAQTSGWDRGIGVRDATGQFRFVRTPVYDFPSGAAGVGNMRGVNAAKIGDTVFDLTSNRAFSPASLAKVGRALGKLAGPVALGLTLADLVWDEINHQWMIEDSQGDPGAGYYWHTSSSPCVSGSPGGQCTFDQAISAYCDNFYTSATFTWALTGSEGTQTVNGLVYPWKQAQCAYSTGQTMNRNVYAYSAAAIVQRPATDAEIEDSIYTELVARGMGSDLARRLIEAGYQPADFAPDPTATTTGPASVAGQTSTSTSTSSAGQTTTTTTTTYNFNYEGDTVNISETKTTNKTNPDNTTETTTETTSPSTAGQAAPPEEPFDLCEEHPEASACEELGDPEDEELPKDDRDVTWSQEGGASGGCPAPKSFSVMGTAQSLSWQPVCDFASGIRPFVIGIAWLSAGIFLFSIARGSV